MDDVHRDDSTLDSFAVLGAEKQTRRNGETASGRDIFQIEIANIDVSIYQV